MEKLFDLKNITKKNICIGNIYIIERTFKNLIEEVKTNNPNVNDLSTICYRSLAKKGATLISIDDKYYIDLDYISNYQDIENINELLNKNCVGNNIIMTEGTLDPYIGQLYVEKFSKQKAKEPKKMLLKLRNAQK